MSFQVYLFVKTLTNQGIYFKDEEIKKTVHNFLLHSVSKETKFTILFSIKEEQMNEPVKDTSLKNLENIAESTDSNSRKDMRNNSSFNNSSKKSNMVSSINLDMKTSNIQFKKISEILMTNNQQSIYSLLSSSKEIISEILLRYSIFSFTDLNSEEVQFPFDSLQNTKLMKTALLIILSAARNVFSSSSGLEYPIIFQHVEPQLASEYFSSVDLKEQIFVYPSFIKEKKSLNFEKQKLLRGDSNSSIHWTDFQIASEIQSFTNNMSSSVPDFIIHEYELQHWIISQLISIFARISEALNSGKNSTKIDSRSRISSILKGTILINSRTSWVL